MAKRKVAKGKKITEECLIAAQSALNLFSSDELKEYISKVNNKAKDYVNTDGQNAIKKAMKEINNTYLESLIDRAGVKARNIAKFEYNENKLKAGTSLKSLLIPTTVNKDHNIERAQFMARNELMEKFHDGLTDEEIKYLSSGKNDTLIAQAASGTKVGDPIAQKIGDRLRDYPEKIRNPLMIESDALALEEVNHFRFLQQSHDAIKISRAGQSMKKIILKGGTTDPNIANTVWREDLLRLINTDETAKLRDALDINGNVDQVKLAKSLDKTFDNIVHNKSLLQTKSTVANDREALQRRKHLTIVFKDWQAFQEYNQKYGKDTLYSALLSDINGSGNRIGLSQIMGDNPIAAFHDLKMLEYENKKQKGITNHLSSRHNELLFKEVANIDKSSWSPTLANIGASSRALSSISRLGGLVLNSLSDISQVAALAQRFGFSYWQAYLKSIVHAFGVIKTPTREHFARLFKANIDSHMGNMQRFSDSQNLSDVLRKVSSGFFLLNGTQRWDFGLKTSAMDTIASGLGKASSKSWNNLHEQTISQLKRFNITEHEWETLRSKSQNGYFTMDNVDNLSASEIKALWEKTDKQLPYYQYSRALRLKVFSLFDVASENSVLDPRAYEKLILSWGSPTGTVTGEVARSVMQFKGYPIASFRRTWYQGTAEMDGYQAKVMYALNMAVGNFALGYLSLTLANLAKGLSLPDPGKMSLADKEQFYFQLLAPGLGTFSRILSPSMQRPELIMNFFFTPSVRLLSDPLAATGALATGNAKQAGKLGKDFVRYANPIGTLPFAEPYIDSFMGKKPYLQPGQVQLFGK